MNPTLAYIIGFFTPFLLAGIIALIVFLNEKGARSCGWCEWDTENNVPDEDGYVEQTYNTPRYQRVIRQKFHYYTKHRKVHRTFMKNGGVRKNYHQALWIAAQKHPEQVSPERFEEIRNYQS